MVWAFLLLRGTLDCSVVRSCRVRPRTAVLLRCFHRASSHRTTCAPASWPTCLLPLRPFIITCSASSARSLRFHSSIPVKAAEANPSHLSSKSRHGAWSSSWGNFCENHPTTTPSMHQVEVQLSTGHPRAHGLPHQLRPTTLLLLRGKELG